MLPTRNDFGSINGQIAWSKKKGATKWPPRRCPDVKIYSYLHHAKTSREKESEGGKEEAQAVFVSHSCLKPNISIWQLLICFPPPRLRPPLVLLLLRRRRRVLLLLLVLPLLHTLLYYIYVLLPGLSSPCLT